MTEIILLLNLGHFFPLGWSKYGKQKACIFTLSFMLLLACWSHSHVQLFATPWTVAQQAPLSMEFSRQEYWSG